MGTAVSTEQNPERKAVMGVAKRRHEEIERRLAKEEIEDSQRVKLLLLGGAESGKSTFVKQMRVLHTGGFTEVELRTYKPVVYSNVATALHQLLNGIQQLNITENDLNEHDIEKFRMTTCCGLDDYEMTPSLGNIIKRSWLSNAVQEAYEQRNELQLLDSAKYFLENIDRISSVGYIPSTEDILRARAATSGVYEVVFKFRAKEFRLVDVGGQRSERRKWIHCFDNATAIIFFASLVEYDLHLNEDPTANRLDDSLALFQFITRNRFFIKTAVLLFLNKKDLLKEKVKHAPLTLWCPKYEGDQSYEGVKSVILREFEKRKPRNKPLYSYFTEATDTTNIELVFKTSMDIILSKALSSVGFN